MVAVEDRREGRSSPCTARRARRSSETSRVISKRPIAHAPSTSDEATLSVATQRAEPFGDGLGPVVEDPPQVAAHEEPVGDRAERPEGQRVADAVVDHGRAVAVLLESVGVLPEPVGALEPGCRRSRRRAPRSRSGSSSGSAPRAASGCSRAGRPAASSPARRGHAEVQPGRRHRLEVDGVAVEGEGLLDRDLDPLAALEDVDLHTAPALQPGPLAG